MTVWEQWCEELKECGSELANKKLFLCNCGLYDESCTNIANGNRCPLYHTKFCGYNYKEADAYLENEIKEEGREQMNETVKVVIEIPAELYAYHKYGIPLSEVLAEIRKKIEDKADSLDDCQESLCEGAGLEEALEIIDEYIGEGANE